MSGEEEPGLHFEGFPDERKVNILQLKHTIDILLYINSRGSVREVDVRNDVTRNFEMSSKLLIVMNRGSAGELDLEDPVIENFCDEVLLPDEPSEER